MSPRTPYSPEELKKLLKVLLENLRKKSNIAEGKQWDALKDQIVNEIYLSLTQLKPTFTRGDILGYDRKQEADPIFLKNLMLTLTVALTLNKTGGAEKLKAFLSEEVIKKLEKKLNKEGKTLDEVLKKSPKEFMELLKQELSSDDFRKIHQVILEMMTKVMEELKKNENLPQPKDDAAKKSADDLYINLYGLINSAFGGSAPVVVSCFIGNGLALGYANPYDTNSQIGSTFNPKDDVAGDPLGRVARVEGFKLAFETYPQHFEALKIDDVKGDLHTAKLSLGTQTPKLGKV